MTRLAQRLDHLTTRIVTQPGPVNVIGWDLSQLTDPELDELILLAEKLEAAERSGVTLIWTPEEVAVLTRWATDDATP